MHSPPPRPPHRERLSLLGVLCTDVCCGHCVCACAPVQHVLSGDQRATRELLLCAPLPAVLHRGSRTTLHCYPSTTLTLACADVCRQGGHPGNPFGLVTRALRAALHIPDEVVTREGAFAVSANYVTDSDTDSDFQPPTAGAAHTHRSDLLGASANGGRQASAATVRADASAPAVAPVPHQSEPARVPPAEPGITVEEVVLPSVQQPRRRSSRKRRARKLD